MISQEETYLQYNIPMPFGKGDHLEIYQNKIQPQKGSINLRREHTENEWQQEYYIIYNSYILDERENGE